MWIESNCAESVVFLKGALVTTVKVLFSVLQYESLAFGQKGQECSAVEISTPCMDIKVSLLLKTIIGYYTALTYEDGWELCFIDGVLAHISVLNVSPPLDNWHKCEHLKTYTLCFVTWICQNYIFNSIWIKISQYLRMVCVYCIHVK